MGVPRCVARRSAALAVLVALVPLASTQAALAAPTFTVTSTTDAADSNPGNGTCASSAGACTLRAAVDEANKTTGATINVPAGLYRLTRIDDLDIYKPMTIVGASQVPGAAATVIDGLGSIANVVDVYATPVAVTGVQVKGGKASTGGGVLVRKGAKLTLSDSTVSQNLATTDGAGIYVASGATLVLERSTVTGNTATGKGGGIYNGGTATVRNSTIDANTAKGGGGIANAGTTSIVFTTITANTSKNSNGGGIYRVGGKFTITGSILAGNNAVSGRDCYGSAAFSGPSIVQVTTGCNPTGGPVTVANPQLGALADNGGPTLTRLPNPTSPAIDAVVPGCSVTIDQRGVARPNGAGCDLGSVESAPLTLDATLDISPDSIGAGIGSIAAHDIPQDLLIDLTDAASDLGSTALSRFALSRFALSRFPMEDSALSRFALSRFALSRFALSRFALSRFLLSDITVDGGWEAVLADDFAPNPVPPLQTLTLADVIAFPSVQALTLGQIDLGATTLGSLPVVDFAFDGLNLARIPPTDDPALQDPSHDLDDERLQAWCVLLGAEACARAGIDPDPTDATPPDPTTSTATILSVSLNSASLDDAALSRFALSRFALSRFALSRFAVYDSALSRFVVEDMALSRFLISDLDLDAIDIDATALSRFALSRFALSRFGDSLGTIVDCTTISCTDPTLTLGDAAAAGAITGEVADLILAIVNENITELADLTFLDLFPGMFSDPTSLPWETLDLGAAHLQNSATPLEPAVTLTATIVVGGGTPATVATTITLPEGFEYVPGSARFDGNTIADPAATNGDLEFSSPGVAPGVHTLSVDARAGLDLGETSAHLDVTAVAGAQQQSAVDDAPIVVVESFELDESPDDRKNLTSGVLYVAHVSAATDKDVYEFEVTDDGQRVSLLLSGLDVDYDMILQGPDEASLRGTPTQELRPVEDVGIDFDARDDQAAPDVQYDVVIDPALGATYSIAASRGTDDEQIETGILPIGTYSVTVRGYNGAFSAEPYVLQLRSATQPLPECAARTFPFASQVAGAEASLPGVVDPESTPADLNTLILTAPRRMVATYGTARTQPMLDGAAAVAAESAAGVSGVVVGVDADPAVAAAYTAWDADRCSPHAANDVARAIADLVDEYRAARPGIDNVVLVGDDSILPMFRVADRVTLSPESTAASAFGGNNELVGALAHNFMLTDDPYGTTAGIQTNVDELFVPEIGVGRLVETPEDIAAALGRFVDFDGRLDGSTAFSATVTGYDFLGDGAQSVADALDAGNGATDVDTLIDETWTSSDLQDQLATDPDVVSINAHADHSRFLPADQNAAQTEDDLYEVSDLAALPGDTLDRSVVFSMGCHAGLSVSDIELGLAEGDWAQQFAQRGSIFAGNTTYGYGDTELVTLSELLDTYFAQQLTGDMTVGRALMLAKQQYVAGLVVLSPYDAKILQAFTLYGLPMFKLDDGPTAPALAAAAASVPLAELDTDPITGLEFAPISFDLPVTSTSGPSSLHEVVTDDGRRYFEVDGNTVQVQYRPVQPLTSADVSRRDPDTGELVDRAHGVLWTDFTSTDITDFDPLFYLPDATGGADGAGTIDGVGDAAFPAAPSRVATSVAADGGEQQQVLFVPGQFRPDPNTPGSGVQRLFTGAEGIVYYVDPAVDDFVPPTIAESHGAVVGTTVAFAVETDDSAQRAYVLFREIGSVDWRGVDLVRTPGTDHWTGGATVSTELVEFGVQVPDQAGNVAYSFNKTDNFLALPPTTGEGLEVALTSSQPPTAGWFTTIPVDATITGAAPGATISYSLDGAALATYTGPIGVSSEGIHFLSAFDGAGNSISTVIPIDTTGPVASAEFVDPVIVDGYSPDSATVRISAIDPGGSGVSAIAWSSDGASVQPETIVPGETTDVVVPLEGTTVVTFAAIDSAANRGASGTITVKVDASAPIVSCGSADGEWHADDVTIGCTATDTGVGTDPDDTEFDLSTSVLAGTETADAATSSRVVCDLLAHCVTAGPILGNKIDRKAPTITVTGPTATNYGIGQVVLADFACDDGGSGVASCSATIDGSPVSNGGAIATTSGSHVLTVTAIDNVGNTSTASVSYAATYKLCLVPNLPTGFPFTIGGYVPIIVKLCNAAGQNLSSSSITLTAITVDGTIDPGNNAINPQYYGHRFVYFLGVYVFFLNPQGLTPGVHQLDVGVSTLPDATLGAAFQAP